jgi:hypothetical protein
MKKPTVDRAQCELEKIETQVEMFRYMKKRHVEPRYTAAEILAAAKDGEINHFDAEHIVKILKEQTK